MNNSTIVRLAIYVITYITATIEVLVFETLYILPQSESITDFFFKAMSLKLWFSWAQTPPGLAINIFLLICIVLSVIAYLTTSNEELDQKDDWEMP